VRIFGGIAGIAVSSFRDGSDTGVADTGVADTGSPDTGSPDTGVPDTALLAAHAAGDEHAFRILVRRHYDYLWQVARRVSPSVDDAADSLQDALLSAHRRAATFREDAAVRSWLHTIVVNACLDRIRRSRARPTVPLIEDALSASVSHDDPIVDVETALDIATALRSLTADQRAAVVAVDVEGYSVRDAARLLGVPEGTVKSRCSRGRTVLAQLLGDFRGRGNRS